MTDLMSQMNEEKEGLLERDKLDEEKERQREQLPRETEEREEREEREGGGREGKGEAGKCECWSGKWIKIRRSMINLELCRSIEPIRGRTVHFPC